MIVTLMASGMIATFTTLRSSRETVERYVSVWEEEVARNLLLKGDIELFEKIRLQILDLASDVDATGNEAIARSVAGTCFGEQRLGVTLYGTPAGELRLCRSPERLALRSIASPVFAFGLLVGLLLVAWQVRRANREAAERALTELAIRVAHDIRSPLMALKMAASQPAESAPLIEAAAKRISAIADDLLDRSRIKPGSRHDIPTLVSPKTAGQGQTASSTPDATPGGAAESSTIPSKTLSDSIHELVREKKMASKADVVFEIQTPRESRHGAPALSSNDLERVISNLLQNAIEATVVKADPHSKPRIVIDTKETESELSVTIRDNGIGIPKDVLPRIGDVGFSYGKQKGNGVGLSSARRWAESRGGELDIRSLEGTGTEVRITLPRRQNPADLQ